VLVGTNVAVLVGTNVAVLVGKYIDVGVIVSTGSSGIFPVANPIIKAAAKTNNPSIYLLSLNLSSMLKNHSYILSPLI
jgi:hypothetical protein